MMLCKTGPKASSHAYLSLVFFFFFLFFYSPPPPSCASPPPSSFPSTAPKYMEFPGQRSDSSCSLDLCHDCGNTGFFNPAAGLRIVPYLRPGAPKMPLIPLHHWGTSFFSSFRIDFIWGWGANNLGNQSPEHRTRDYPEKK